MWRHDLIFSFRDLVSEVSIYIEEPRKGKDGITTWIEGKDGKASNHR